ASASADTFRLSTSGSCNSQGAAHLWSSCCSALCYSGFGPCRGRGQAPREASPSLRCSSVSYLQRRLGHSAAPVWLCSQAPGQNQESEVTMLKCKLKQPEPAI